MSDVKSPSPSRREKAAATRQRMIEAAFEVISEVGYAGARMPEIARRAGVAVQTLYFTFHTKGELLRACYEHGVLGPERLPPPQQEFWQRMAAADSASGALAAFGQGNAAICSRVAVIDEAAMAARHELEAAEIREQSERLRRDGYRAALELVTGLAPLRQGLSPERAVDLMLLYAGPGTYLTLERLGWSTEQIGEWVGEALARELLGE